MKEKPEEIIKTTIRIPRQLSVALKDRVIDENCNFQELVRCGLDNYQAEGGPAMRGNGRIFKRKDTANWWCAILPERQRISGIDGRNR